MPLVLLTRTTVIVIYLGESTLGKMPRQQALGFWADVGRDLPDSTALDEVAPAQPAYTGDAPSNTADQPCLERMVTHGWAGTKIGQHRVYRLGDAAQMRAS